jgi:peptidoglycan/LPS O-acetylase OafA/YrhL
VASAESTIQNPTWKRLDGIDLLRGLAIFFVLVEHVHIRLALAKVPYTKFLPAQLWHFLVGNGELGVQMFFAVSGFLITSISLRRWAPLSEIKVRDFYTLRFARIAPLFLLLLTVLSGLHFTHVPNYVVTARTGGLGRALLAALTFHINVLEARTWYLPGNWDILWSLSVEEMFYLFFPIVCFLFAGNRLFGRGKLFILTLITFVVLGPFGRTVWTHGNLIWRDYSYLGGMEGIALGCLTALIVSRFSFSRPALWSLGSVGALIVSLSLIFSWQTRRDWLGQTGLRMTILGIGACMFIAATAQTQWKAPRVLRLLLKIGEYSYEVYLTHMFVVYSFFGLFLDAGKPMRLVPVLFVVTILIAALLGAAVARLYSEPMNRILRNRLGPSAGKKLSSAQVGYVTGGLQDGTVAPSNS